MQEMFLSTKRPFYQSTQTITIGCIDRKAYYDFSATWFARQNLLISEDTFSSIYDEFEGHTWYIQAILNRLYGYSLTPDQEMVSRAIREIVAENEYGYQNLLAAYTSGAIRLIKAIAKEPDRTGDQCRFFHFQIQAESRQQCKFCSSYTYENGNGLPDRSRLYRLRSLLCYLVTPTALLTSDRIIVIHSIAVLYLFSP